MPSDEGARIYSLVASDVYGIKITGVNGNEAPVEIDIAIVTHVGDGDAIILTSTLSVSGELPPLHKLPMLDYGTWVQRLKKIRLIQQVVCLMRQHPIEDARHTGFAHPKQIGQHMLFWVRKMTTAV